MKLNKITELRDAINTIHSFLSIWDYFDEDAVMDTDVSSGLITVSIDFSPITEFHIRTFFKDFSSLQVTSNHSHNIVFRLNLDDFTKTLGEDHQI